MKLSKEHKKVLLIVGSVCVVLIIATALLSFWEGGKEYKKDSDLLATGSQQYADKDQDGLADWEEILWRTDPENPDTDDDGTTDGDEILQNRNPWVAGPDDSLIDHPAFNNYEDVIGSSTSTSEKMAIRLVTSYQELKERGIPITPEFKASLIASSLNEVVESAPKASAYTKKDILTKSDSSKTSLKNYGTHVANIISINTPRDAKNEYVTMLYALHNEDYSVLTDLNPVIAGYQDIRDDLLALSVPEVAQDEHLYLINSVHALQHVITLMSLFETDPAIALAALEEYEASANRLGASFRMLNRLFSENGITYSSSEAASMFSI